MRYVLRLSLIPVDGPDPRVPAVSIPLDVPGRVHPVEILEWAQMWLSSFVKQMGL